MNEAPNPRRRDLLNTAITAGVGIGLLSVLWVVVSAMSPTADVRARRQTFHLSELGSKGYGLFALDGEPILILRRSSEQLEALDAAFERAPQDEAADSTLPEGTRNPYRSLRREILVCSCRCTHDGCVVLVETVALRCPCCGSRFDLAGRAIAGPAPRNLAVPRYQFVGTSDIEFS